MGDIGQTKKIQETTSIPSIQPLFTAPLSGDDPRTTSTISKASERLSHKPSKPLLDPPSSPFWETLNQVNRLDKAANQHGAYKESQIESHLKEMEKLHLEEAAKLEEAYQTAKDVGFWSLLEDVGNTLMSSVSLFYGFSALSSGGTVVGGALIASGVLSISNLVFKYTDAWNWVADQIAHEHEDLKSAIKTYIPCAVGIAAAATGIYGSYYAWNLAYATGSNQAISILKTAGHLAAGLTSFANGRSQSHLTWAHAQLSELQISGELVKLDIDSMVEEIKDFQKKQSETQELAARLIEEASQAIQSTMQPV